jgi:hypothetical protein
MNRRSRGIKNPLDQCQADPEILVLGHLVLSFLSRRVIASGHLSFDPLHHAGAGAALACGFENALALASAERIAASFVAPILARPIGLPLLVPLPRALASPACIRF